MNTFDTRDFYLACFLHTVGIRLSGHSREGSRVTFHFKQTEETENLVDKYFRMDAEVNPIEYSSSIKHLKHVMYDYTPLNIENRACQTIQGTQVN